MEGLELYRLFSDIATKKAKIAEYEASETYFNKAIEGHGITMNTDITSILQSSSPVSWGNLNTFIDNDKLYISLTQGSVFGYKWKDFYSEISLDANEEKEYLIKVNLSEKVILEEIVNYDIIYSTKDLILAYIKIPEDYTMQEIEVAYGIYAILKILGKIEEVSVSEDLILTGSLFVESTDKSVKISSEGMKIFTTTLKDDPGVIGSIEKTLRSEFNANGIYFYDEDGTVLAQFTKDNENVIAGWTITPEALSAGNISIKSTGEITGNYSEGVSGWKIASDGTAEFNDVIVRGTIYANEGAVGGWTIGATTLSAANLILDSTGNIRTNNYVHDSAGWKIASDGTAEFNDVTVRGTIYANEGSIATWTITESEIKNGNIVLDSGGEIYTANYIPGVSGWKIRFDGFAEFSNAIIRGEINANTGTVGGWTITSTTIEAEDTFGNSIILNSNGTIQGNYVIGSSGWQIQADGSAEFNDVTVRGTLFADTSSEIPGVVVTEGIIADNITTGTLDTNRLNVSGIITAINNEGSTTIDGAKITTGTIIADHIDVSSLSSISANIGTKTAGKLQNSGGTSYFDLTNDTFALGNKLTWNGTTLTIDGSVIASGINADNITTGTLDTDRLNVSGIITAINAEGSTTIDGAKITTGTITAEKLEITAVPKNILRPQDWVLGSTGSQPGFNKNGDTEENQIVLGENPHGVQDLLWECIPDTESDPDGGWHTTTFEIDPTKTYRYSVWVKKIGSQDGTTYLGCQGNKVKSITTGNLVSNPYFWSGDLPELDKWYLIVGYILPHTYTGEQLHLGGIYDRETGKKVLNTTDYKWYSEATTSYHRAYLYYCTDTDVRQYFWNPRVDLCDGNEPSLQAMLSDAGLAYWRHDTDTTKIDGGKIYTESIKAAQIDVTDLFAQDITVNTDGVIKSSNYTQGYDGWQIASDGSAEFNDVIVRGTIESEDGEIGGWTISSTTLSASNLILDSTGNIRTNNYIQGNTGWKIASDGSAEFNDIIVRGTIESEDGEIGGWTVGSTTLSASNLILDSTGNIRTNNYIQGNTGWKIASDGTAEFNDVTVRGIIESEDGEIGGFTIGATKLSKGTDIELDSDEFQIRIGDSKVKIGKNVQTSNYYGIKVNTDYWETNGTTTNLNLGGKLTYNGSTLSVNGTITSTSGSIGGFTIGSDYLLSGTSSTNYSLLLDKNASNISMDKSATDTNPSLRIGMNADGDGKVGLAIFSGLTHTDLNNYWLVNPADDKVSFRVGNSSKYMVYDGTNLTLTGTIKATAGYIGGTSSGWQIDTNKLKNGTDIVLDASTKQITIKNGAVKFGYSVSTNKHGLYIDSNNYFVYDSSASKGKFKIGDASKYLLWDGTNLTLTGTIKATAGYIGGTSSGWLIGSNKISSNGLELNATTPYIGLGVTAYNNNDGIWLGKDSSWKLSIKNSDGSRYLKFDGSALEIAGTIKATAGYIGGTSSGWSIGSNKISSNGLELNAATPYIGLGVTTYNTNGGIWLGKDSSWKLSIKNSDGSKYLKFDGSDLELKANFRIAEDDNYIEFIDSGMKLIDAGYSNIPYTTREISITDPDSTAYNKEVLIFGSRSDFGSYLTIFDLGGSGKLSFFAPSGNSSPGYITFYKGDGLSKGSLLMEYVDGGPLYFKFTHAINVLITSGRGAANLPPGSILVQGNRLYYRDEDGDWHRAAIYSATPD